MQGAVGLLRYKQEYSIKLNYIAALAAALVHKFFIFYNSIFHGKDIIIVPL